MNPKEAVLGIEHGERACLARGGSPESHLLRPYASFRPLFLLPQAHLNLVQLDAMHKALRAEDYGLILVIRGTGKTTAIALIRELVKTAVELVQAFWG